MRMILHGILTLGLAHSLVAGVRADDRADAMSLIDKALKAAGGAHKLAKEAAATTQDAEDLLLSRAALALEELAEPLLAHAAGNLVAAGDAWGDSSS